MSGLMDVDQQADRPQDYKNKIFIGVVKATVDPDGLSRIKVFVPEVCDQDDGMLPWAIPGALSGGQGPDEASLNIPRVGSKVYVEFQDGDTLFPVYYGGARDYQAIKGVLAVNYPHRVGWMHDSYTETGGGANGRETVAESVGPPTPFPQRGHHWFLDRSTNEVEYQHAQKTRFNIAPNGSFTVEILESGAPMNGGDMNLVTEKHLDMKIGHNVSGATGGQGNLTIDVERGFATIHVKQHLDIVAEGDINITSGTHIQMTAPRIDLN